MGSTVPNTCVQARAQEPATCKGMEEPKNPNFTIKISIISKHPCDADPFPPCLVFSHALELAADTGKQCWNLSCRPIKAVYLQHRALELEELQVGARHAPACCFPLRHLDTG